MTRGDARYRRLTYPPTAACAVSSALYVVGGGGGKAKSGVPNRITLVADGKPDLQEKAHVDFGDDRVVGLALHPKTKMCLVTTSEGKTHGCAYTDKSLTKLFSATTAAATADGEFPSQRAVAVSPKGDALALGMGDKVALWKLGQGTAGLSQQKLFDSAHAQPVKDVLFFEDATHLVSIDDDSCVLWQLPSGKVQAKGTPAPLASGKGKLRGVALGASGSQKLYTCINTRDGGFVEERDLADKELKVLRTKQVTGNPLTTMSRVSRGGKWLSFGDSEGNVILWNVESFSGYKRYPWPRPRSIERVALSNAAGGVRAVCAHTNREEKICSAHAHADGVPCVHASCRAIESEVHVMPVTKVCALDDGDTFSVSVDNFCALGCMQAKMAKRGRAMLVLIFAFVFFLAATFAWFQLSAPHKTEL